MTKTQLDRRTFLAQSALIAGAISASSKSAAAQNKASDQIAVGVIGCGSRGFNLIDDFTGLSACRIVAVCDVDDFHYRDREWGKGPKFGRRPAVEKISRVYASPKSGTPSVGLQVYADYRELIGRKDIDAVVIATPDHWHARCTFDALQAGKDVYCEKPITHTFAEGQAIVAEVARRKAVFQTGSQQRSDLLFRKVVELTQNGVLGQVHTIEVGLPPGYSQPMGSTDIVSPRKDLDYDFWCGPSPVLPLMQARHHRWWRGHRAYGGGVLMDWIGHHNDIAQWAIGQHLSGPTKVEAGDWKFPQTDIYNTPQDYTIRCEYSGDITSTISSRHTEGLKIMGSEGWAYVRRGKIQASDPRWLEKTFQPGSFRIADTGSHAGNFLSCITSRDECVAPAEVGHRSITPGHLGYVSNAVKRPLQWDTKLEQIVGDPEADKLLKELEYRSPWKVPGESESA